MHVANKVLFGIFISALAACSGGTGEDAASGEPDHVWSTQTEALEKAKQLESTLNDAAERNFKEIDKH